MKVAELIEQAFLAGYRAGQASYAWWKNGEQFVGSCGKLLRDAQREAPQDAKPHFEIFMRDSEARWVPQPVPGGQGATDGAS